MNAKEIVRTIEGAINHLEKDNLGKYKSSTSNYARAYFRLLLPYVIKEEIGRNGDLINVVLNREYKPLGIGKGEVIDYEDFPCLINKETYSNLKKLIRTQSTHSVYLYNDGNPPWSSKKDLQEYMSRVVILVDYLKRTVI